MNAKPNVDEIVKALREIAHIGNDSGGAVCRDAADLIEHLTGELAVATASNKRLAENYGMYSGSALERADELIESLEEQLAASQARERAVAPKIIPTGFDMGKVCCPVCDHVFFHCYKPGVWNKFHERRRHCKNCGQKLEWRGPEAGESFISKTIDGVKTKVVFRRGPEAGRYINVPTKTEGENE